MKRILKLRRSDIDEENEYNLVVGVGYEYTRTTQNDKTKNENRSYRGDSALCSRRRFHAYGSQPDRVFAGKMEATTRAIETKLTIERSLKVLNFNFKPYASGELFYDRNDHSWEENRYAFGVQLPYKKRLMVDTYYLRKELQQLAVRTT